MSTSTDPVRARMAAANPAPANAQPPSGVLESSVLLDVIDRRKDELPQRAGRETTLGLASELPRGALAFAAALIFAVVALGAAAVMLDRGGSPVVSQPVSAEPEATAQTGPEVLAGSWQTYSTEAGLPPGPAGAVSVDPSGAVWALAGDKTGVYRLDGDRWTHVASLPSGMNGGIWLAATNGVVVVPALRTADEVATLLVFDGTEWRDLEAEGMIPQLGVSVRRILPSGELVVAAQAEFTAVLVRISSDGIETRVAGQAASSAPSGPPVHWALTLSDDGVMWAGGANDITAFDGDEVAFYEPLVPPAGGCCVSPLAADPQGGMWVQIGRDLYRFDSAGWRLHTGRDDLPDVLLSTDHDQPQEWAIVPTPDGSVWLFHDNGVAHHDGTSWTGYNPAEAEQAGIPTAQWGHRSASVTGPDGSVWLIWSSDGALRLSRFSGSSWASTPTPDVPLIRSGSHINGILAIGLDGSAWVGTSDGVARFTPDDGK